GDKLPEAVVTECGRVSWRILDRRKIGVRIVIKDGRVSLGVLGSQETVLRIVGKENRAPQGVRNAADVSPCVIREARGLSILIRHARPVVARIVSKVCDSTKSVGNSRDAQ